MKHLLLIAITSIAISISACSCIKSMKKVNLSGVIVNKNIEITSFNTLSLSSSLDVKFIKGDKMSLSISGDSVLVNRLEISNDKNNLKLGLRDNLQYKTLKGDNIKVVITSDKFPSNIKLRGSVEFESEDFFDLSGQNLSVDCSGSSEIENLNILAKSVDIDLSGASQIEESNIKAENIFAEISGASEADNINLDISKSTKIRLSGASEVEVKGKFSDTEIKLSGSSTAKLGGSFGLIKANLSGASNAELSGTAKSIEENTSGASKTIKNITFVK